MNVPSSDYTPGLEEVGEKTRSRTRDSWGAELGTFTADTRPDFIDVGGLISGAVGFVEGFAAAGDAVITTRCADSAKEAVIFRVAFQIEMGYFPEQITGDHSPYDQFVAQYDAAMNQLARCLGINAPDVTPGSTKDEPETALPMFGFPVNVQGMTRYLERAPVPMVGPDWVITVPSDEPVPAVAGPLVRTTEVGDGTVFVHGDELAIKRLPVNLGAGNNQTVVAAVVGKKIRVVWAQALARSAEATITFKSDATAISPIYDNGPFGGFVFPRDPNGVFETNIGEALKVDTSAAIGLMIGYMEV